MNVYEATIKRFDYIFAEFDNIYVSFSGGKDSAILLNMALDYMEAKGIDRKLPVFHIDYEAQYQSTTDYVLDVYEKHADRLEIYHICLPIAAQCATSMHQSYWIPWEKEKKQLWVRDIPEVAITEDNNPFEFFVKGMWDYEFQEKFGPWLHDKMGAGRTAALIGNRTDESMNRWRSIHSDRNINRYEGVNYTRKVVDDVYNVYPIFDWKAHDVWVANAKFEWDYNGIYDLFHQAGLTIDQMRCASPFNDCAIESLKLYKVIDPRNWAKMLGRVDGVNFSGIYGGTTAMGWKSIKLPKGHTWKSYMYFLLDTLPEAAKKNYLKKLDVSIKSWGENAGGALTAETIAELESEGAPLIRTGKMSNRGAKDKEVIQFTDYMDDTTVTAFKDIPTYKRMCICIMKNDHLCKYMGFGQNKTETAKRQQATKRYKDIANK